MQRALSGWPIVTQPLRLNPAYECRHHEGRCLGDGCVHYIPLPGLGRDYEGPRVGRCEKGEAYTR